MCRDCAPAVTTSTKPNFTGPQKENGGVRRPVDYINEQLDDAIKQNIVEQYNVYATQVNPNNPLGLNNSTLEKFVGSCSY